MPNYSANKQTKCMKYEIGLMPLLSSLIFLPSEIEDTVYKPKSTVIACKSSDLRLVYNKLQEEINPADEKKKQFASFEVSKLN